MKWDLKRPCKLCPFRKGSEGEVIRFACRSRAEEIEESAYREGFVCHEHSTYVEGNQETGEGEGYTFGEDGEQHCVGALMMYLYDGGGNVPFEWLEEKEQDRIQTRLETNAFAEVYEGADEFLDSYGSEEEVA